MQVGIQQVGGVGSYISDKLSGDVMLRPIGHTLGTRKVEESEDFESVEFVLAPGLPEPTIKPQKSAVRTARGNEVPGRPQSSGRSLMQFVFLLLQFSPSDSRKRDTSAERFCQRSK